MAFFSDLKHTPLFLVRRKGALLTVPLFRCFDYRQQRRNCMSHAPLLSRAPLWRRSMFRLYRAPLSSMGFDTDIDPSTDIYVTEDDWAMGRGAIEISALFSVVCLLTEQWGMALVDCTRYSRLLNVTCQDFFLQPIRPLPCTTFPIMISCNNSSVNPNTWLRSNFSSFNGLQNFAFLLLSSKDFVISYF